MVNKLYLWVMANNEKIQIYLQDIIEEFEFKSKAKKRGGKFLKYDMPDNTTILISHN